MFKLSIGLKAKFPGFSNNNFETVCNPSVENFWYGNSPGFNPVTQEFSCCSIYLIFHNSDQYYNIPITICIKKYFQKNVQFSSRVHKNTPGANDVQVKNIFSSSIFNSSLNKMLIAVVSKNFGEYIIWAHFTMSFITWYRKRAWRRNLSWKTEWMFCLHRFPFLFVFVLLAFCSVSFVFSSGGSAWILISTPARSCRPDKLFVTWTFAWKHITSRRFYKYLRHFLIFVTYYCQCFFYGYATRSIR